MSALPEPLRITTATMQVTGSLHLMTCTGTHAGRRIPLIKRYAAAHRSYPRPHSQVTNNGIVHLAVAAKRLRTLRLFGTGASAGMVNDRFAKPPAQTVTVDKHAWWLQRPATEAVAVV